MELSKAETEWHCDLCSFLNVYDGGSKRLTKALQRQLFHDPCDQCNEIEALNLVKLCTRCRHFRIWHIQICRPAGLQEYYSDLWVEFEIPCADIDQCDFCQFIRGTIRTEVHSVEIVFADPRFCKILYSVEEYRLHVGLPSQYGFHIPTYINWGWIKVLLKRTLEIRHEPLAAFTFQENVGDLRVVDVLQKRVIQLPRNAKYVALSYVWGIASRGQFELLQNNVDLLEKSGSLREQALPSTINDAITVCEKLNYGFLWVDRLCIVQDAPLEAKSIQLDQMVGVYQRAELTIVAVTGEDVDYGLDGVSRKRQIHIPSIVFSYEAGLVAGTLQLDECLQNSKWLQRGWTYQEALASSTLMFITQHGVFFHKGTDISAEAFETGTSVLMETKTTYEYTDIVADYTERQLTYSSDILRAISGLFRALYGDQTSFGLPFAGFDTAMLWSPTHFNASTRLATPEEVFPSWSWIAIDGSVSMPRVYCHTWSLAFWGKPSTGIAIISKALSDEASYVNQKDPYIPESLLSIALAWREGCIDTEAPFLFYQDQSKQEIYFQLKKRWPSYSVYLSDILRGYAKKGLFKNLHVEHMKAGCLPVYTQRASFVLRWSGVKHNKREVLLEPNHTIKEATSSGIIGVIVFDTHYTQQRIEETKCADISCIALSVSDEHWEVEDQLDQDCSLSKNYGCPCSDEPNDTIQHTHVVECPKHNSFFSPLPREYDVQLADTAEKPDVYEDLKYQRKIAKARHLISVSYYNSQGQLLHNHWHPPALNVMLIAPSTNRGVERNVYQRLGIGQTYLKRWVESSPVFKTIVLE